jgi:uncharacterized protein
MLAASLFFGSSHFAQAQSFDCGKASTPVELAICRNPDLGRLDQKLEDAFRKQLAATPEQRQTLLAGERAWVAQRDARCVKGAAGKATLDDCLANAYRDRISAVQVAGQGSGPTGTDRTAICASVVQKYRAFLAALPSSSAKDASALSYVLKSLADSKSSGVTVGGPGGIDNVDPDKLSAWAQSQRPPFSIPASLIDAIKGNVDASQELHRLPGTNYYVVNGTAGTLYCYGPGVYFQTENGKAKAVAAPHGWARNSEGGGCTVLRGFGMIDSTPIAYEENNASIGSYSLNITPWQGTGFGQDCTATFHFTQRFAPADLHNYNTDPDDCDGDYCDGLKKATWDLVKRIQDHAQSFEAWRKAEIERLTPTQARQFQKLFAAASADGNWEPETVDEAITAAPLLVPLVEGGNLYLAKVGHLTMGDFTMPDWKVELLRLGADGQPNNTPSATFNVGMQNGPLAKVTVE